MLTTGGPCFAGLLFGCGIAASMIDLFIFHLGLQWHHFYDRSTTQVALTVDAFFHAAGWCITVWGLFLLADVRRRTEVAWKRWTGPWWWESGSSSSWTEW